MGEDIEHGLDSLVSCDEPLAMGIDHLVRFTGVLEPIKTVVLEINTTICQTVRFGETKRISNPAAAQLQK